MQGLFTSSFILEISDCSLSETFSINDICMIVWYEVSYLNISKSKPMGQPVSNNFLWYPKIWTTLDHIYLLSIFLFTPGCEVAFLNAFLKPFLNITYIIYKIFTAHTYRHMYQEENFEVNALLEFNGVIKKYYYRWCSGEIMHSQSQENIFPREVAESGILETLMMEAQKQSCHKSLTSFKDFYTCSALTDVQIIWRNHPGILFTLFHQSISIAKPWRRPTTSPGWKFLQKRFWFLVKFGWVHWDNY